MAASLRAAAAPPRRRVAAIQLAISADAKENIARAGRLIDEAAEGGATFVALPECFTGKYGVSNFAALAEKIPEAAGAQESGGAAMMAERAKRHGIYLTGGVIELSMGSLFNTMPVFDPSGALLSRYRKVHLSRVLGITSESDVLTAGDTPSRFELQSGTPFSVGMACCFDLRFPRFLAHYGPRPGVGGEQPIDLLCAPSAFLDATGGPHWELLLRRSALDGQHYVMAPNCAFDATDAVPLHGRTAICDPWGEVIASCAPTGDAIVFADLDAARVREVREKLPLTQWSE